MHFGDRKADVNYEVYPNQNDVVLRSYCGFHSLIRTSVHHFTLMNNLHCGFAEAD